MSDKPQFNYAVASVVAERLDLLFKDLPAENVQAALEEFIDDYAYAMFGVNVMEALREVKLPGKSQTTTTQTLAHGRAVLISSYGFKVKSQSDCKCGRAFIVLDENNHEDFQKEMEEMGG